MKYQYALSVAAASLLGLANISFAAAKGDSSCGAPEPAAPCYTLEDKPACNYCLGPEMVAPATRPKTCNGDVSFDIAGFYWNAHQDGLEYAITNQVQNPEYTRASGAITEANIAPTKTLIGGQMEAPSFKWDFGFKLGLGYNSTHDGWDIGVLWTWYQGRAKSANETEASDAGQVLLPIWSGFSSGSGSPLFATDITSNWKLKMNLVDIDLGREFWTSKYLTLRPHVGIRVAFLNQNFDLEQKGGSFAANDDTQQSLSYNDFVSMTNDFKGAGIRAGLDSIWNFGSGWGLYGNIASSLIYGKFSINQKEQIRQILASYGSTTVMQVADGFRSTKATLDMDLGIEWSTMFSSCRYGFTARLGWENHLFFNQNQLWRVVRSNSAFNDTAFPNTTGDNVYSQSRGDLSTQGWTLNLLFEF